MTLQEKIKSVENALNDRVLERHAENHALMLALTTRTHIVLIGAPGTGKSQQLRLVKDLLGLTPEEYWEYEFDPFMTPDQTEGPISLKKLTEDDEVVRITKHKLPQAKVANLQECFKCLAGDTTVVLADGRRIRMDDPELDWLPPVLSLGFDNRILPSKPVRRIVKPPENIYLLQLKSGRSIRATADHQFLTRMTSLQRLEVVGKGSNRGVWGEPTWKSMNDLMLGEYVAVPRSLPVEGSIRLPDHEVDVLGLMIADGCCTESAMRAAVSFTNVDPDVVRLMKDATTQCGSEMVVYGNNRDYMYSVRGPALKNMIRRYGMVGWAYTKHIPDRIFTAPNEQVARFIGRAFSCDGYIARKRKAAEMSYTTTSIQFVDDMMHLLLRLGIDSYVIRFDTPSPFGHAFRVIVRETYASRFREVIGPWLVGAKRELLDSIEIQVDSSTKRRQRIEQDLYWDPVVSVTVDAVEPTYCFEMPSDTANFVANDIVVHNCNSATLNTLLSLLNERVHYNPDPQAAPLSTAMASSNELPDDERLAALADRFLTWIEVKRLSQPRSFIQMLENAQTPQPIEQVMTWEQLVQAQIEVSHVKVPVTLYEPLAMLREQLYRESIVPSDRRWVEAMKLVQAEAWMNGRSEAKLSDCRPLRHCLWSDPVQIPVVEKHVLEMASELDRVALELNEAAASLLEYLNALTAEPDHEEAAWRSRVVEFGGKLRRHEAEMDELAERYRLEQETSPVFEGVERLTNYISDRANKEIFEGFTTKRRARKTGESL